MLEPTAGASIPLPSRFQRRCRDVSRLGDLPLPETEVQGKREGDMENSINLRQSTFVDRIFSRR